MELARPRSAAKGLGINRTHPGAGTEAKSVAGISVSNAAAESGKHAPSLTSEWRRRGTFHTPNFIMRIAAILLVTVAVYGLLNHFFFQTVAVSTDNAERQTVHLPDGSIVELNAASKLIYSKNGRELSLTGEAFF